MTQNQLDIPQISFERYLDLLKRRKWQVLPVSVLGLLVGAIVASLVPQYYVALSVVHYEGQATGDLAHMQKDPMMRLVRRAKSTIPNAVKEALHELGWPEAHGPTAPTFHEQVESRVHVQDEKGETGRQFADLRITYKDTDLERAVAFTNTLVRIWKENEIKELENRVTREVGEARQKVEAATRTVANVRKELLIHEQTHELNPADFSSGRDPVMSDLSKEFAEVERDVRKLGADLEKKRKLLESLRRPLTDGTIPPTIQGREDSDARKQLQALLGPVQRKSAELALKLSNITPLHKEYVGTKQAVEIAGKELKALLAEMAEIATQDRVNPEFQKQKNQADRLQGDIEADEIYLKLRGTEAERLGKKKKARPPIVLKYRAMMDKLEEAKTDKDAYKLEWKQKKRTDDLVRSGQTIKITREAKIPRTPTETSGTLIALAGSLIGLGIAIGLILLLDTLRTTFKTVDDVERGLTVPVLGAMAYLQTADERVLLSRTRRRVSLALGVFVILSVSLVTVYYVAPWRLPDIVHQALDMLLGAPG